MKYKLLLLAFALILMLLPAAACSGYIDLSGYVYVWDNAPPGASSQVLNTGTAPAGYQITPLKDARVVFEDKDKSHRFELTSLTDGYFHLGTSVEMDEYLNIDVTGAGYQSAHGRLDVPEDKSFYSFIVLLVPAST